MDEPRLQAWRQTITEELDRVVAFWTRNSHDQEHGGFFTCLSEDGTMYDDLKYVWLQGRQVWMYCRLYRKVARFQCTDLLDAAVSAGEFLLRHARVSAGSMKCAFVLTRDGKAIKVQRTIFSECFYVMAMDELWRVTAEEKYKKEAIDMMDQIVHWVRVDATELGRPAMPGTSSAHSMAVPMMLLNLVDQLEEDNQEMAEKYSALGDWCAEQILQHLQRDGGAVLETISKDGKELPGCLGRHQNPGHAIEAGWFLLRHAIKRQDLALKSRAIEKFILLPFQAGWDEEHGGLFSFLDVDGHCPTQGPAVSNPPTIPRGIVQRFTMAHISHEELALQLEWNMKMWWPHSEAMIAFLLAYCETREPRLLEHFHQVYGYVFSRFSDPDHGEWYGYLSQEGKVALTIKGGPFKGCFHVPRCLYMCLEMLDQLLTEG